MPAGIVLAGGRSSRMARRRRGWIGTALRSCDGRLYERFGQRRRPVLLVIDEAPQLIDRVDIAELTEVSRSAGVGVLLAMQDAAQIKDEGDRSLILSNAATFAILPGSSPKSVAEFGSRLGQRYEQTVGLNVGPRNGFGGSRPSQSFGTQAVPGPWGTRDPAAARRRPSCRRPRQGGRARHHTQAAAH